MNEVNEKLDISILIVTYNPSWNKLKKTIYSILIQKNIKFEIVISDDGSKENHFEKIKEYFVANNFENYKLVANSQNLGTVKNIISGLKACSCEYVKDISPGDYLYDENTLFLICQKLLIDKKEIYFGKSIYYSFEENALRFYDLMNPKYIAPYIKENGKIIKKNYLLRHDYILGASVVVKTSTYLEYLRKIENCVKYAEDCAFIYMIADGIIPVYIQENIVWYEYGTGISTNANQTWKDKITTDNKNTFLLLKQANKISSCYYNFSYSDNFLLKIILSIILDPARIIIHLFSKKKINVLSVREDSGKLLTIQNI